MLGAKHPAMETQNAVTVERGTLKTAGPLGRHMKDIFQSILNPESHVAFS